MRKKAKTVHTPQKLVTFDIDGDIHNELKLRSEFRNEAGEIHNVLNETLRRALHMEGPIKFPLVPGDLELLTKLAVKKGISVRDLIRSIVHQYVEGALLDAETVHSILCFKKQETK